MSSYIPQSIEETILRYLRSQEEFPEYEYDEEPIVLDLKENAEEKVRNLLENLLLKVNKRIVCKDRYDNLKAWHGQYPLFNLEDYIPDFCLDDELMDKIAFRETILISNLDPPGKKETEPRPVGGMVISVQAVDAHLPEERPKLRDNELDLQILQMVQKAKQADPTQLSSSLDGDQGLQQKLKEYENFLNRQMEKNVKKFVVHMSSQFNVKETAGSTISAWVDRNLHTLEEKRSEYIYQPDNTINSKSLYVAIQCQKYYLHHVSKPENFQERKYYNLCKTFGLVCEGANFILMRYIAITRYSGTFELSTMYINGDMCRNIYECTGPQTGFINNEEVEICKIYRYIIEECGIEHHCVTVLTTYGRIISQEWEGCNYILNINPLLFFHDSPKPYEKFVLRKTWMDDMELLSKYLDQKTEAEKHMKTFMSDHPQVKDILADYLNNILLMKPENVIPFTMDYFQSLFPTDMAKMGFFDTVD